MWLTADRTALWAHLASLPVAAAFLFFIDRHRWFLWDEWDFFAVIHPWFLAHDWKDFLFAPHASHWITIPNILFEAAYRIGGTHHYWVYLVAPIAAHLGVTVLVRLAMLRSGVAPWPATLLSLLMLFTGAGAGNLVFGWQITFVGSVFFGLAQLLLSDHEGPIDLRDAAALLLGLCGLMCSGVSLALVPMVGINLALRARWRAAAVQVVPLALAFIAWWVAIGHHAAPVQPLFQIAQFPAFVWTGISATFDGLTGMAGIAPLVLIGVVVLAVRGGILPRVPPYTLPWAMASAPWLLFLVAAYGRIGAGVDYATGSRYVYVGVACFLPLIAVVVTRYLDRPALRWVFAAALAWAMLFNLGALYFEAHFETDRGLSVQADVLALAKDPNLMSMDPSQPVKLRIPAALDLTVGVVQRMVRAGDLP